MIKYLKMQEVEKHMQKTIDVFKQNLIWIQAWRVTPSLIENIQIYIESYWMSQKLNQIASITNIDNLTLKIESWDKKILWNIEKWLIQANLWTMPINHGEYIILKFPPLTEEKRKELTKIVDKLAEEAKIALRNIRHEEKNKIKKTEWISEDEKKRLEEQLEKITKKYIDTIDQIAEAKKKEILQK